MCFFVQRNHDKVARYEALKKSFLTQTLYSILPISCHWSLSRLPENIRGFLMFSGEYKKKPVVWYGLIRCIIFFESQQSYLKSVIYYQSLQLDHLSTEKLKMIDELR